ncbi:MAG: 2-amino-4-hydroxy-6-hydroxymethyldihydropteridine diphosphokinase [Xenococcaceae cyanobacterium]
MTICAIALGSNLGNSIEIIENSLKVLNQTPGIAIQAVSSWYKTKPIGPPQPDYINGCSLLEVKQTPEELLVLLLATELQFGRVRQEHWGARTLDLDLLLYDDLILDTPNLQLPHPRMKERAFVLVPLAEIAGDRIEPVSKKAIAQLANEVDCSSVELI